MQLAGVRLLAHLAVKQRQLLLLLQQNLRSSQCSSRASDFSRISRSNSASFSSCCSRISARPNAARGRPTSRASRGQTAPASPPAAAESPLVPMQLAGVRLLAHLAVKQRQLLL